MKVKITNTAIYDLDDPQLQKEFSEWLDDYHATFEMLQSFLIDRYINPYFDPISITRFEMLLEPDERTNNE